MKYIAHASEWMVKRLPMKPIAIICFSVALGVLAFTHSIELWNHYSDPDIIDLQAIHVVTKQAAVGEVVRYTVKVNKKLPIISLVVRKLHPTTYKGTDIDVTPDITGTNPLGQAEYDRTLVVPIGASTGQRYQVRSYFIYDLPNRGPKTYIKDSDNDFLVP